MIKVFLVDDHQVVRNGLKLLLETQEYTIVGEANSGNGVFDALGKGVLPDIIITDMNMVGMDGLELTKNLAQDYPDMKVVFLTMVDKISQVRAALDAGAKGYLIKDVGYDELLYSIQHIHNGGIYICEIITLKLLEAVGNTDYQSAESPETNDLDLSPRELEILQLLSDGLTTKEISEQLFISKRTVEGHRQNLLTKTETKNYAELIKFSLKNRLVN